MTHNTVCETHLLASYDQTASCVLRMISQWWALTDIVAHVQYFRINTLNTGSSAACTQHIFSSTLVDGRVTKLGWGWIVAFQVCCSVTHAYAHGLDRKHARNAADQPETPDNRQRLHFSLHTFSIMHDWPHGESFIYIHVASKAKASWSEGQRP